MKLLAFFEQAVSELEKQSFSYALAGGMVASIYRGEPRATKDIDFVILAGEAVASSMIKKFGLKATLLRKAELEGGPMFAIKRKSTPICIVAGRADGEVGLDLILPELPWAEQATLRAQNNKIDFGFAKVPCLTIEDFIVSKLFALKNQSTRFMDLDDLKSIFEADKKFEMDYLVGQIKIYKLKFPEIIKPFVPDLLLRLTKK